MDNTGNHFDTAARSWDTEESVKRSNCFAREIKNYLPQSLLHGRVLDLGCGTGLLSQHFVTEASFILGIDTAQGMLEQFNLKFKHNKNVMSLILDLEKDSLPSDIGKFDFVVSSMAFHHLNGPVKMLKLLKENLSSEGFIFVIDLDKEDGTFHPDNEGMGVKHFGFSKEEMMNWGNQIDLNFVDHKIIYTIAKNDREYGVGMAVYSFV